MTVERVMSGGSVLGGAQLDRASPGHLIRSS